MEKALYERFTEILKSELLPATGCTEPIAVAYAAALARDTLGEIPLRAEISVSGNILKNVKSVVVPATCGMRGIAAAAAAGIVLGEAERKLEVLAGIRDEAIAKRQIETYLATAKMNVVQAQSGCIFDIGVRAFGENGEAFVRIAGHHTNVVKIEKNGAVLCDGDAKDEECCDAADLTVERIVEYAETVDLASVAECLERQIDYNTAIAEEGLKNDYGARVGKVLLAAFGSEVHNLAKATAAAGSDARMNGCKLPVVIVSGSGNQGMTASLPVIVYAKHLGVPHEKLLRALALSDLVTIHLKSGIGRLSAFCGAVSAGCGAGAGVCYLYGGKYDEIAHTIVNALAIDSGIVCDGAKSSCAAKIASAVEAGLVGMEMYRNGSQFYGGDGILERGVEKTITNVGDLARKGMRETDEEIIRLMIKSL
jgi:L-cysteine desulfidase